MIVTASQHLMHCDLIARIFAYQPYLPLKFILFYLLGIYVAARHSGDKKWYRAEVIAIPSVKMVTIFYIDFGISEILSWKHIKVLFSRFYKLPPQVNKNNMKFYDNH